MDLGFLCDYLVLVVVGICLCIGFVVKKIDVIPNKFIPLIMAVLGVLLNMWLSLSITPEILLGGMFSGLASTGLYEAFRNLINDKE